MNKLDVSIIGHGPAGLSAAIYTSRAGLKTQVIGCDPKVAGDYFIDNYFGCPEGISGKALIKKGAAQAKKFGTKVVNEKVLSIEYGNDKTFTIKTEKSKSNVKAVILATGISRSKPKIPDLDSLEGKGVSYCVSCDGFFYKGKKTVVLGEGNFAVNQAMELLQYTKDVALCTDGKDPEYSDEFKDFISTTQMPIYIKKVESLIGDKSLTGIKFTTGEEIKADGLFIAIGDASLLDFSRGLGVIINNNYIEVNNQQRTNVEGVYAAGDCTGGFMQISAAVGEGANAGKSVIDYIKKL